MKTPENRLRFFVFVIITAILAVIISWIAIRNFEAGAFIIVRKVAK